MSVCLSVSSNSSLSLKVRELEYCRKIPNIKAKIVTNQIFEMLP